MSRSASDPIVLLHGATSSSRAWESVLPELRGHVVITPTLAGHLNGPELSVAPRAVVDGIVDAMETYLDRADIGKAHLVGNSLGGWVALELARRGRATSVLALSPAGAWRNQKDLRRLLRLFRIGAAGARHEDLTRKIVRHSGIRRIMLRPMAEHGDRLTAAQVNEALEDMAGCSILTSLLAGARDRGPIHPFDQIDCPVRIAWGLEDRTLPFMRYGVPMLSSLPGAELTLVPGVGHVPMIDEPELVGRMILDFVDTVTAKQC